jgi:hypothetical protein
LKKYSLTSNSAEYVKSHVKTAPYTTLHLKDLKIVEDSYKAITEGATKSEQATPEYATAGQLMPQVTSAMETRSQQIKDESKREISQVTGYTSGGRAKQRVRVTGDGMRKPRKKRVKRSKSKGKSPKTTSRPSQKEESEPETGLEKWRAQKKYIKKMRL